MTLDETQNILDKMAGTRSQYEFDYFMVEDSCNLQRQLRNILREKEKLTAKIQELNIEMTLEKYQCTKIDDAVERSLQERLIDSKHIILRREIRDMTADLAQCDAWLAKHDKSELTSIAEELSSGESEFWVNHLGRQSAVEVLADNKVSADTMRLMCLLPLEDYRRCVMIMHRFAEFIKQTTIRVEQQFTVQKADDMPQAKENSASASDEAREESEVKTEKKRSPVRTAKK